MNASPNVKHHYIRLLHTEVQFAYYKYAMSSTHLQTKSKSIVFAYKVTTNECLLFFSFFYYAASSELSHGIGLGKLNI